MTLTLLSQNQTQNKNKRRVCTRAATPNGLQIQGPDDEHRAAAVLPPGAIFFPPLSCGLTRLAFARFRVFHTQPILSTKDCYPHGSSIGGTHASFASARGHILPCEWFGVMWVGFALSGIFQVHPMPIYPTSLFKNINWSSTRGREGGSVPVSKSPGPDQIMRFLRGNEVCIETWMTTLQQAQ